MDIYCFENCLWVKTKNKKIKRGYECVLFFQTASDARECKFILIDRKLSFECPQQGILYFPWTAARCTLLSTTSNFTICRSLRHFLGHEFLLPPVQCLPFSTFFFFLKLTDFSNHFFLFPLEDPKLGIPLIIYFVNFTGQFEISFWSIQTGMILAMFPKYPTIFLWY